MSFDTLLTNGNVLLPSGLQTADIGIKEGLIAAINPSSLDARGAKEVLDLGGLTVLPGIVDSQVHFREPGLEGKEDFESGSRAALKGGLTCVFDMPNTLPPTTNIENFNNKVNGILGRSWVNFGLFAGAIQSNIPDLKSLEKLDGAVGIKVFMGKSTGNLLLHSEEDLRAAFSSTTRRFAIHSEDEDLLEERKENIPADATSSYHPEWRNVETAMRSTQRVVKLAEETKHPIHILHITTADELEFLSQHKTYVTLEILPQHLVFSHPESYERLGSSIQMNPPIRAKKHQEALWKALEAGVVDVIGSDHAPHTLEEKQKPYPQSPSGMPGVQTLLPLLLNFVNEGKMTLESVVRLTTGNLKRVYGLNGYGEIAIGVPANLSIVDMKKKMTVTNEWIESKCGWTPYDGMKLQGVPTHVIVNGDIKLKDQEILGQPNGQLVSFDHV